MSDSAAEESLVEAIAAWISRLGDGALNKAGIVAEGCMCLACQSTQTACVVLARMLRDGSWRGGPALTLAERKTRSRRETEPGGGT